ncbi:MAG: S46 family peptidase [Dysgonamonadaceae bacterium]|jgi:hypothetical protein|nr:S46 family peptidase [Dysgonamonadaceae bacterium]MDD3309412.1 S46 family peptidase [Dysgonamonadaceae bacterium]MDD3901088.1 S46 family peptidase [Dysgonamonadaceae bacterium]MDD4399306.1 S46 family peptidase [Dysgonamonadaceae bacterium]MEA5080642.1 S46 family peptidase [Dysgonamonadaceae bacterium]
MRRIILSFAFLILALTTYADEGMWLLKELNKQSIARMKELGFKFPANKLYDENNASLKDAVVIFGGGCTGAAVSEQGLIFTNHHCGFGAIQKLSAVEHDYLKDGFAAKSFADELPAEGLNVSFLRSTKDVSDEMNKHLPSVLSETQRGVVIDSISKILTKPYAGSEFVRAQVIPFYTGNKFYMVIYDVFRDVRLVVTPPQSIGKFGGDTDNWMWPRHTGDFSVFRVYADANNKPAKYSESNKPYKPKYVIPVSLKGVKQGDFAMTIGYPGSTSRYLSSWGINQRMESENKPRIEVRGAKQDIWWNAMTKNDTIRIKYASKYAGSSNYWKNSIGMNEALTKYNVIGEKQALEARLNQWINSSAANKQKYGNVLSSLESAYNESAELTNYSTYFMETFLRGIEIIGFANSLSQFDMGATEQEKSDFVKERLINTYKDYEPTLDKKLVPALMKLYAERVPEEYLPSVYNKIKEEFDGDYQKYADWLFSNSKFTNLKDLVDLLKSGDVESLTADPVMQLNMSVRETLIKMMAPLMSSYQQINKGERDLMAALMEMDPKKNFYPDATFTQRMSYGSVKGYSPKDAVYYDYFTTSDGVLQKVKPGDPEFDLQPEIITMLENKNFGKYAGKDGKLHVGFLSTNDITGGNSGSPVFNGKAELIGLAFDGNWESLSGDILFDNDLQRCINVDILYVLYTIDEIMNAPHIINELRLVK